MGLTSQKNNLQTTFGVTSQQIDPLKDGISSVELLRVSGSDLDIANAARVSYGRVSQELSERDHKLIAFLMEHNHTSPFEHNQLSFRIKAPIFIARQWMRHRMHSYNEISYRYVTVKTEFYKPAEWRLQDTVNKQSSHGAFQDNEITSLYDNTLKMAYATYEKMLASGVCREQARAILPVATYTEFIFTTNLHALMHFLKLRMGSGAQKEIRNYAQALFVLALPYFPIALGEWNKIHGSKEWLEELEVWTEKLGDQR
jgi:thymidylate synthase (FAD)